MSERQQSRIVRWFAEKIARWNSYTVELDVEDECPRCGSEDNPVPICVDGVFKEHCRSCGTRWSGVTTDGLLGAIQYCPNCGHPLEETEDRVADTLNKLTVQAGYQVISCYFCRNMGVEKID